MHYGGNWLRRPSRTVHNTLTIIYWKCYQLIWWFWFCAKSGDYVIWLELILSAKRKRYEKKIRAWEEERRKIAKLFSTFSSSNFDEVCQQEETHGAERLKIQLYCMQNVNHKRDYAYACLRSAKCVVEISLRSPTVVYLFGLPFLSHHQSVCVSKFRFLN